MIKYFYGYMKTSLIGDLDDVTQSFFTPKKLRNRKYFLQEGRLSSVATNSLKKDACQSYLFIIPVGKLIFSLRVIFLTLVSLMATILCNAQSDTVRIARQLKDGSHYLL